MKQELIPLNAPHKWKQALEDIPIAFGHTWESCYAMFLSTGNNTFLYQFTCNDVKIICPLVERAYKEHIDIQTPYGFSGFVGNRDFPEFQSHWDRFVQEQGYLAGYIGLNPMLSNQTCYVIGEIFQHNTLYVLNLEKPTDELFRNLHLNRRRQLKNYEYDKAKLTSNKTILKSFFIQNFHSFFSDKNVTSVYNFSLYSLSFLLDLDNVITVGIYEEGEVKAVSVFGYTPYGAEYLFNISLPEGQRHTVALLWYGINLLKTLNIPYLNLGGGVNQGDSLSLFKQRFGAQELPLKSLKQVYNLKLYSSLCEDAGVSSKDLTGYFPAYRQNTLQ